MTDKYDDFLDAEDVKKESAKTESLTPLLDKVENVTNSKAGETPLIDAVTENPKTAAAIALAASYGVTKATQAVIGAAKSLIAPKNPELDRAKTVAQAAFDVEQTNPKTLEEAQQRVHEKLNPPNEAVANAQQKQLAARQALAPMSGQPVAPAMTPNAPIENPNPVDALRQQNAKIANSIKGNAGVSVQPTAQVAPEGVPLSAEERLIAEKLGMAEKPAPIKSAMPLGVAPEGMRPNPIKNKVGNEVIGRGGYNWVAGQEGPKTPEVWKNIIGEKNVTAAEAMEKYRQWKLSTMAGGEPGIMIDPLEAKIHGASGGGAYPRPKYVPKYIQGGITPKMAGGVALGASALAAAPYVIDAYKKGKLDPLLDAAPITGNIRKGEPIDAILDAAGLATDFHPYIGPAKAAGHLLSALSDVNEEGKAAAIERKKSKLIQPYDQKSWLQKQEEDRKFFGKPSLMKFGNEKLSKKDAETLKMLFQ